MRSQVQPARARARRLADRLVYGKRATPYEVMSEFSDRLAGTYAMEDILPRMARILAEGTGARHAAVWLRVGGSLRRAAAWPVEAEREEPRAMEGDELPAFPGADMAVPVRHQGEVLGAVTVSKAAGDPPRAAEEKLLSDLAAQAGLVLRNVRLTEELLLRLDELQASRQRIVSAQDQERRRIERNIHDGAQQQLVALAVKLRLADTLADRDLSKAHELLARLQTEVADALDNLRDLARGIYPPLLADQGLAAALRAQAGQAPIPVDVVANGIGRYPQDVEAAIYFCSLEALQNVAKYAGTSRVTLRLISADGTIAFEAEDDGKGFDPATTPLGSGLTNMADRLAALNGELEVSSTPGVGTVVRGRIPAAPGLGNDEVTS